MPARIYFASAATAVLHDLEHTWSNETLDEFRYCFENYDDVMDRLHAHLDKLLEDGNAEEYRKLRAEMNLRETTELWEWAKLKHHWAVNALRDIELVAARNPQMARASLDALASALSRALPQATDLSEYLEHWEGFLDRLEENDIELEDTSEGTEDNASD